MFNQTRGACDYVYHGGEIPRFVPNPDVAGIGVLIGFLATAYFTFLFVIVYYLTGCVEEKFTNEIDKVVLAKCSLRKYLKSVRRLELTLRRAILMFSGQQVVTGIALLSSGYAQLKYENGIAVFHWQILVYLAWFSSLTHLTTLTILRQYFQNNKAARLWRSLLMLVTVTMLGVALVPTGDGYWISSDIAGGDLNLTVPALCFFHGLVSRDPSTQYTKDPVTTNTMILSLFVLVSGYLTRFVKLSEKATAFSKRWIRTIPSRKSRILRDDALNRVAKPSPKILKSHWVSAYVLLETLRILLRALLDISESMLWEMLWLAFALAWGTRNLYVTRVYYRAYIQAYNGDNSDDSENTWGFGQLFPVLLLVLPLLSIGETYYEKTLSPLPENQGAASDGDVYVKNKVQLRLLRVGQWGPKAAMPERTSSDPPVDPFIVRRTGTDIQTEEEQLDSINPRILRHSDSPTETHNTSLSASGNGSSPRKNEPDQDAKYYEFEWVWILILMLITSVSVVFTLTLTVTTQVVRIWSPVGLSATYTLIFCFSFTAVFVALSYFHEALEKIFESHLRFSPRKQETFLRVLAWLCLPSILVMVTMKMLENVQR